jgi:transposase
MYRVKLTAAQREELQRRAHDPTVKPRTRDRLEMVRLSHAGWSVPRIARHLGLCEKRVRHWIKGFLQHGFDALPDRPHPGQRSALTPALEEAIRAELRKGERTWTAAQLADWLAEQCGVRFHPHYLGQRLRRARISYKRTSRSLKHKQKPEAVAAAKKERAAQEKRGIKASSM